MQKLLILFFTDNYVQFTVIICRKMLKSQNSPFTNLGKFFAHLNAYLSITTNCALASTDNVFKNNFAPPFNKLPKSRNPVAIPATTRFKHRLHFPHHLHPSTNYGCCWSNHANAYILHKSAFSHHRFWSSNHQSSCFHHPYSSAIRPSENVQHLTSTILNPSEIIQHLLENVEQLSSTLKCDRRSFKTWWNVLNGNRESFYT